MIKFYIRVVVYLLSFAVSLYALHGVDFNRFIKKGRIAQAQTLYIIVAMMMGYLLGSFFISVIYYFYI